MLFLSHFKIGCQDLLCQHCCIEDYMFVKAAYFSTSGL